MKDHFLRAAWSADGKLFIKDVKEKIHKLTDTEDTLNHSSSEPFKRDQNCLKPACFFRPRWHCHSRIILIDRIPFVSWYNYYRIYSIYIVLLTVCYTLIVQKTYEVDMLMKKQNKTKQKEQQQKTKTKNKKKQKNNL